MVEDDEGLRNLICRTLNKTGFEVRGVGQGKEAAVEVENDPALVLLLDQRLPDMSGSDLVALLGQRNLKHPFVIMTGQGDERLAVEMMKLGAADYLVKGMDLLDLLPATLDRLFRELETKRQLAETEQALRDRESQLLQAQKMESVGRLAGGVAHDFNNMLGVILGHTELALNKIESTHPAAVDLVEVRKAAERSASLIRQLLAYARKQTIAPRVLDLRRTVEGMMQMLRRLIGENIELVWKPAEDLWPVCMDPSQLDQIMTNLCVNARDAISGSGQITIETGQAHVSDEVGGLHRGAPPGDYVLLSIADSGSGMDEITRAHLFEPFFTTKEVGAGTGLGLSTVYGIVRQNEGHIQVESELGKGTVFRIYLPRYTGTEEKAEVKEREEKRTTGSETILIVEDEPAILEMSGIMLRSFGYRVICAATPKEAIRTAREHNGEIHLLMTDVVMPEMNGRDLAKALLSMYPNMKRVFMSGYTAEIIAHHGVLDEGVFFLAKPFTMNDLSEKVREALDRRN